MVIRKERQKWNTITDIHVAIKAVAMTEKLLTEQDKGHTCRN